MVSCKKSDPVAPQYDLSVNEMSFVYDDSNQVVTVYTQPNGYAAGEVVLRASGRRLTNTLMLTFKPVVGQEAVINPEMTGYWDLGLCIPFDKYLLDPLYPNSLQVISSSSDGSELLGTFNLRFIAEDDASKTATFTDGRFRVKIDFEWPFSYCVEG